MVSHKGNKFCLELLFSILLAFLLVTDAISALLLPPTGHLSHVELAIFHLTTSRVLGDLRLELTIVASSKQIVWLPG